MQEPNNELPVRLMNEDYLHAADFFYAGIGELDGYPLHWHEFWEFELVCHGEGVHMLNGRSYPLQRGSCFVLSPVDYHQVIGQTDSKLQIYNLKFSENWLSPDLLELLYQHNRLPILLPPALTASLELELRRILLEYEADLPYKEKAIRSTLERLIIDYLRESAKESHAAPEQPHDQAVPQLMQALTYVHRNFRDPLSLARLAKLNQMSASYFSECFHRLTGVAFASYVQRLRLQYAAQALCSSSQSVTEICYASGFHTLPHFLRTFKSKYGQTPLAYRRAKKDQLLTT